MTEPVFFTTPEAKLRPGQVVRLDGDEGHHAADSFRLRPGEVIDLVNGLGGRASGTVQAVAAGQVDVRINAVNNELPPAQPIWLVQGLAKHKRDEQAVSAAVELGVDRVIPWQAERSVVRWPTGRAEANQARWAALVKAATKVARRAYLPPVEPLVTTSQLIDRFASAQTSSEPQLAAETTGWPTLLPTAVPAVPAVPAESTFAPMGQAAGFDRALVPTVLVLHEAANLGLVQWFDNWQAASKPNSVLVLVVGPEGGISQAELSAFQQHLKAEMVNLGRNVLRSSTAGPAAIAALCALTGRWSNLP